MNWLKTTAWPFVKRWTVTLATEWWVDIGEKPRPHFVSMVIGVVAYAVVKLMVVLAK